MGIAIVMKPNPGPGHFDKWKLKRGSDLLIWPVAEEGMLAFRRTWHGCVGIDISEQSIAEARIAHLPLNSMCTICESLSLPIVDGAYCLFTSLGYRIPWKMITRCSRGDESAETRWPFCARFMNTHAVLRDLVPLEEVCGMGFISKLNGFLKKLFW